MRGTGHPADRVGGDPVDPRIHLTCKKVLAKMEGLSGHKRVYARLRRAMPGNDDLNLAPSGFAGRYPLASALSNTPLEAPLSTAHSRA